MNDSAWNCKKCNSPTRNLGKVCKRCLTNPPKPKETVPPSMAIKRGRAVMKTKRGPRES